jgi:hypothetical protein
MWQPQIFIRSKMCSKLLHTASTSFFFHALPKQLLMISPAMAPCKTPKRRGCWEKESKAEAIAPLHNGLEATNHFHVVDL